MNYQNIYCFGDSQTNGARTYTSWPHYLALELERRDKKLWNVIERAVSGYTAKDLLKLIQAENIRDCSQACVMIGTNDCKNETDPQTFGEYMHRIRVALRVRGISRIIFAEIPTIHITGGDYPYTRESAAHRDTLNRMFLPEVAMDLPTACYVDAVHFSDYGNREVAKRFAEVICET